jgi:hypothetical protein
MGLGQAGLQGDATSSAPNQTVGAYGKATATGGSTSCATCAEIQSLIEDNPLIMVGVLCLVAFAILALAAMA